VFPTFNFEKKFVVSPLLIIDRRFDFCFSWRQRHIVNPCAFRTVGGALTIFLSDKYLSGTEYGKNTVVWDFLYGPNPMFFWALKPGGRVAATT
jgi:hypothetical protein